MKYHNHWVAILYLNKKNDIFSKIWTFYKKSKQTADMIMTYFAPEEVFEWVLVVLTIFAQRNVVH